jgi:hypothetical protein
MYKNFEDNMIQVFDDFISLDYQEKIKNTLIGGTDSKNKHHESEFPWYFIEDVTASGDEGNQKRSAFSHQYVVLPDDEPVIGPGIEVSDFHSLFLPLLQRAAMKLGLPKIDVYQGRSFLQFPLKNIDTSEVDSPHVDIDDFRHFVVLYYVCDSDGDTIIYNEKQYGLEKYTEKQRVSPKQGRCVIFDGTQMHTAEQPINSNIRCVVNYNLN